MHLVFPTKFCINYCHLFSSVFENNSLCKILWGKQNALRVIWKSEVPQDTLRAWHSTSCYLTRAAQWWRAGIWYVSRLFFFNGWKNRCFLGSSGNNPTHCTSSLEGSLERTSTTFCYYICFQCSELLAITTAHAKITANVNNFNVEPAVCRMEFWILPLFPFILSFL